MSKIKHAAIAISKQAILHHWTRLLHRLLKNAVMYRPRLHVYVANIRSIFLV